MWTTASPRGGVSDQDVWSPWLPYHSPYTGESMAKSSIHLLLVSLFLAAGIFQMSLWPGGFWNHLLARTDKPLMMGKHRDESKYAVLRAPGGSLGVEGQPLPHMITVWTLVPQQHLICLCSLWKNQALDNKCQFQEGSKFSNQVQILLLGLWTISNCQTAHKGDRL